MSDRRPSRERVVLVVECTDDEPPALAVRLRRVIKGLLRSHGVRLLWHQDAPPGWHFGEQLQEQAAEPAGLPDGGEGLYDSTTERGG